MTWERAVWLAMVVAFATSAFAAIRRTGARSPFGTVRAVVTDPVAALLLFDVIADVALPAIRVRWLTPWWEQAKAANVNPFVIEAHGDAWVATQVYRTIWIAWAPALCAVVAHAFGVRRPWPMLALWIGTVVALTFGHFWGYRAKPVYLVTEIASIAYAGAAFVAWAKRRESARLYQRIALALLLFHGASLVALRIDAWKKWDLARVSLFFMFAIVALLSGGAACSTSKRSSAA